MIEQRITVSNLNYFKEVMSDQGGFHVIFEGETTFAMGIVDPEQDRPVGCICGTVQEACAELQWIFVAEEYRNQGIGRGLLTALENFIFLETDQEELQVQLSMLPEGEIRELYSFFRACGFEENMNSGMCMEFKGSDLASLKEPEDSGLMSFSEMSAAQRMDVFKRLKQEGFVDQEKPFLEETNGQLSGGLVSGNQVLDFLWVVDYGPGILRIAAIVGGSGSGEDLMKTCLFVLWKAKALLQENSVVICEIFDEKQYKLLKKLTGNKLSVSWKAVQMVKAV